MLNESNNLNQESEIFEAMRKLDFKSVSELLSNSSKKVWTQLNEDNYTSNINIL
jgi:hypothetical protein